MLTKREAMAAMLAMAPMIGSALGQIAPPPGPAAEATPEVELVAPGPNLTVPGPILPTPIPAEIARLWRDQNNQLEELTEPLYWAGIKKNSLIAPKDGEGLKELRHQRDRQYERIVVDNIDLMRKVVEGAIEKVNDAPRNVEGRDGSLTKLLQILKPLVGDNIREAIKQKGLLTRLQMERQDLIKKAYTQERGRDVDAAMPAKAAAAKEKMRHQFHDFIDESTWAYAGLLNDVALNWEGTLAKVDDVDIDQATKARLNTAFADAKAAKDDKGRVAAMKKLVLSITFEQERELLRAVLEVRPAKR